MLSSWMLLVYESVDQLHYLIDPMRQASLVWNDQPTVVCLVEVSFEGVMSMLSYRMYHWGCGPRVVGVALEVG